MPDSVTFADLVVFTQVLSTAVMFGLIWFVQVVHYPLMGWVGPEDAVAYENEHVRRTGFVVNPAMLLELVTTLMLPFIDGVPAWLAWTGVVLLGVNWASTFLLQVPLHLRLCREFDPEAVDRLVRTNWIRTAAWSGRAVLVVILAMGW